MADEQKQPVSDQPRPADEVVTRRVLIGYGHQCTKMPPSTLKLYKEMETDYAVGMCLGLLSFPIVASEWSIEVKDAGKKADGEGRRADQPENLKSEISDLKSEISNPEADTAESIQKELTDMLTPIWRDAVKHMLTAVSRKAA